MEAKINIKNISALFITSLMLLAVLPAAMGAVSSLTTDKSSYVRGELITISGVATPNQLVGISVNDPLGTAQLTVSVNSGPQGSFSRTYRTSSNSILGTWTVTATEGGSSITTTFTLQADTTPPVLSISLSPSKSSYEPNEVIVITVASNENLQNTPTVTVGQSGANPVGITMSETATNTWSGQYTVVAGRFGIATIRATGSDLSLNTAVQTATFNVAPTGVISVKIDTAPIYYPGDTVRVSALTMLDGNLVEATLSVAHVLTPAGTLVNLPTPDTAHPGLAYMDWDLPNNAAPGVYTIHIQANYLGLNGGDIVTFEINNNLPSSSDVSDLSSDISSIRTTLSSITTTMNNGFNDVKNTLGTDISDAQSEILNAISSSQNSIQSSISSSASTITSNIDSSESSIISQIESSENAIINAVQSSITGIESSVSSAVSSIVSPLSSQMDQVVDTVNEMDSNLQSVSDGVASASTWILIVGIIAAVTLVLELVALIRKLS